MYWHSVLVRDGKITGRMLAQHGENLHNVSFASRWEESRVTEQILMMTAQAIQP